VDSDIALIGSGIHLGQLYFFPTKEASKPEKLWDKLLVQRRVSVEIIAFIGN